MNECREQEEGEAEAKEKEEERVRKESIETKKSESRARGQAEGQTDGLFGFVIITRAAGKGREGKEGKVREGRARREERRERVKDPQRHQQARPWERGRACWSCSAASLSKVMAGISRADLGRVHCLCRPDLFSLFLCALGLLSLSLSPLSLATRTRVAAALFCSCRQGARRSLSPSCKSAAHSSGECQWLSWRKERPRTNTKGSIHSIIRFAFIASIHSLLPSFVHPSFLPSFLSSFLPLPACPFFYNTVRYSPLIRSISSCPSSTSMSPARTTRPSSDCQRPRPLTTSRYRARR